MFRSKKYKAKFWCCNCGADFKLKLPFGVFPVKQDKFYYLYDSIKQGIVDCKGNLVQTPFHPFCKKCGSYEIQQLRWHLRDKNENRE